MTTFVRFDWCESYEFDVSLRTFLSSKHRKTIELGQDWFQRVEETVTSDFLTMLNRFKKHPNPLHSYTPLLTWLAPDNRTVDEFLKWFKRLSAGEIYDIIVENVKEPFSISRDLGALRDEWYEVMECWNREYFKTQVSEELLSRLKTHAEVMEGKKEHKLWFDVIEEVTQGLVIDENIHLKEVILIPHYHFRPWNITEDFNRRWLCFYPAEVMPSTPGEPPAPLLRLTRALGDESRLRMLQVLAEAPKTFTQIVDVSGLSKGTVHHHLVALRAAGLIRLSNRGGNRLEWYELNPHLLREVTTRLGGYLYGHGKDERDGESESLEKP